MKLILFIVLIYFIALSCATGKDIPEAELTRVVLISADTIYRFTGERFVYKWYDESNKVFYIVYSNSAYSFKKGDVLMGLIRK